HALRAQSALSGEIRALAFAPDGRTAISCDQGGTASLWDAADGRALGPALVGQGGVISLAFAPDGRTVLTGGRDGTARFWDVKSGRSVGPTLRLGKPVACLAFSTDGRLVVAGGEGNRAKIWDAATGDQVGEDLTHPPNPRWDGYVGFVSFSTDGRRVFTASRDGMFRLWNATDALPTGSGGKHPTFTVSAALSPDGRRVLTVGTNGGQIWDLDTGEPDGPLLTHQDAALVGAFHPSQPWVAIGYGNGSALVWDLSTRPFQPLARTEQGGSVRALAFAPGGDALLTANDDGTARLWEVPSGRPLGGPLHHPRKQMVTCVAFASDGRSVVTGCQDGVSRSWSLSASRAHAPSLPVEGELTNACFSPDGRLALTGDEKRLRIWDVRTGRPVGKPMELVHAFCSAFSADGRTVLAASYFGEARLFDVQTGELILERLADPRPYVSAAHGPSGFLLLRYLADRSYTVIDPQGEATYVGLPAENEGEYRASAISADGSIAAVGLTTGFVRVWNVVTGERGPDLPVVESGIEALSLSADGRILMVGDKDGTARVWNAREGSMIGQVLNHSERIRAVALSPDGRLAVTSGNGRAIRVWETATGTQVGPGFSTAGAVGTVAFSPDGQLVLAGDGPGQARFWNQISPAQGSPDRLALRASVMTNLGFDDSGNLAPLSAERWDQLRRALETSTRP
ncbi:MAG: WD40 repeat domain-containing protein, partial [Isosphaeraceae bacterium]